MFPVAQCAAIRYPSPRIAIEWTTNVSGKSSALSMLAAVAGKTRSSPKRWELSHDPELSTQLAELLQRAGRACTVAAPVQISVASTREVRFERLLVCRLTRGPRLVPPALQGRIRSFLRLPCDCQSLENNGRYFSSVRSTLRRSRYRRRSMCLEQVSDVGMRREERRTDGRLNNPLCTLLVRVSAQGCRHLAAGSRSTLGDDRRIAGRLDLMARLSAVSRPHEGCGPG